MANTFNCPNCGAPLDYKGSDPIIRCPYCNGSVVVPENLRAKPAFSSQPHNYTLTGMGSMGDMINQARRIKEVKDLARAGNQAEAERIYAQITGASSEQAEAAVQALSRGQPITLTGMNFGQALSAQPGVVMSTSQPGFRPVLRQKPGLISRAFGCLTGCVIVSAIVIGLSVSILPMIAGNLGISASMMPAVVQTALPQLSSLPNLGGYGTLDLSFGGKGTGPGLFDDVRAIGVDPNTGEIYAADYGGGRVQKFDTQGKFLTQFLLVKKDAYISSLVVDRQGNVFIVESGELLQYDKAGNLVGKLTAGTFDYFQHIALGADGSLYVTKESDVIHMKTNGQVLDHFTAMASGDETVSDAKIAVDGLGNIYLLGTFNNAVFKFSPDGKFINRFGSDGDQPGQFTAPYALAIDGKGQIYVSDFKGIQVFSNDGRYMNVLDVNFSYGIAFDDQGRLYITTNQNKVERYILPK